MVAGGVVLGYLRGGRLRYVGATRLRWWALVALAAGGHIAITGLSGSPSSVRTILLAGISSALVGFAWANRMLPGTGLLLVGFALNAMVIILNSGMPVSHAALLAIGDVPHMIPAGPHHVLEADDRLWLLADVLPVPALRSIYSIGDVTVAAGTGTLVTNLMRARGATS
ncbi:MAG: DUF5317 family protein [Egibacteraceae bacterium]